jgi:hypothetical protein
MNIGKGNEGEGAKESHMKGSTNGAQKVKEYLQQDSEEETDSNKDTAVDDNSNEDTDGEYYSGISSDEE